MKTINSHLNHIKANKLIPAGVNSPFRSFHEVGGEALFMTRGESAYIFDVDDNKYIDYVAAWGPLILGHNPKCVIDAIKNASQNLIISGAPHESEFQFAQKIIDTINSIEMIRFVNSGTEACTSAIRLARGYTNRNLVLMFEGNYHGHIDVTLASPNHQSSTGIPENVKQNTIMGIYNDCHNLKIIFEQHASQLACVILEVVTGSMGVIEASQEFIETLRDLCNQYGVVLIFDEVLTGFRISQSGAQKLYNVKPDLTCLGKILAGGLPVGAYGGKSDIMKQLMPLGQVYQAGTFSGNPLSMTCGLALINELDDINIYNHINELTNYLANEINNFTKHKNYPVHIQHCGSMFSIIFSNKKINNYNDSLSIDSQLFAKFFHIVLNSGIYLPPSAYDAACVSNAHTTSDIEQTIEIFKKAFGQIF